MATDVSQLPRSAHSGAPWPVLAGLGALAAVAFWDLVGYESYRRVTDRLEGANEFFFAPTGASPGYVLGIAAYLLYHRHRDLVAAWGQPARPLLAGLLLVLSVASLAWAQYTGAQHLLAAGLGFFLLGAAESLSGRRGLQAVAPSAFLVFLLVPAPALVFNAFVYDLQLAIAAAAVEMVSWVGIEGFQAGDQIVTRQRIFQVIESCTGLRITETLVATAPLYAAVFHRSDRRMLALVALTPVIGLLVNQVRVVSLVLSPYSHVDSVHLAQGLIMMVVGVLGISAVDRLLERRNLFPRRARPAEAAAGVPGAARFTACIAVGVGLVVLRFAVPGWSSEPGEPSVQRLRTALRQMPSTDEEVDREFLGSVDFTDRFHRRYEASGREIGLFVGIDDRTHLGRSIVSTKTEVGASGWILEDRWELPTDDGDLRALVIYSPRERARHLVLVRYGGVSGPLAESARYALALDRTRWRREAPAWAVRVDARLEPGEKSLERTTAALQAFLEQIEPQLGAVGIL